MNGGEPAYSLVTHVDDTDAAELWPVYDAVFGDQDGYAEWRDSVWDRHTGRAGFRLARARVAGTLAGFGYGYRGEHGQWWTDHATRVLPAEVAERWLGGHFEVVSIGVLAGHRRHGIGMGLMRALTAGLGEDRWLLMTTAEPADPARLLYARDGWHVIGPGLRDDQVIMARHGQPGR